MVMYEIGGFAVAMAVIFVTGLRLIYRTETARLEARRQRWNVHSGERETIMDTLSRQGFSVTTADVEAFEGWYGSQYHPETLSSTGRRPSYVDAFAEWVKA